MRVNKFVYHVFLAHNSRDNDAVDRIERFFKANLLKVWNYRKTEELDPEILTGIGRGLSESSAFAIIIGPNGPTKWLNHELRNAILSAVQDERPLVVILL